jgi:hypothetical protein
MVNKKLKHFLVRIIQILSFIGMLVGFPAMCPFDMESRLRIELFIICFGCYFIFLCTAFDVFGFLKLFFFGESEEKK